MKLLITVFSLLLLGAAGFIVHREEGKARARRSVPQDSAKVVTISTGERTDIQTHVPPQDLVVVEFTADF